MVTKFSIKGLDCANCAAELERKIAKIEGIESILVNFLTEQMHLECNEEKKEEIIKQVKKVIKKEEPDVELEEL